MAICVILLSWVFIANEGFQREVLEISAAHIRSVELCPMNSNEIPASCSRFDDQDLIVRSLKEARKTFPPSHAVSRIKLLMRISTESGLNKPVVACFVVNQYEGDEDLLYLSHIRPETDCGGGQFEYSAGSLAIKNFLRGSVGQRH